MFNLFESTKTYFSYTKQESLLVKLFLYTVGINIFIELIRFQVPEIKLLQLIPGFYLLFLFLSFLFLLFFTKIFSFFILLVDEIKEYGIKTLDKVKLIINVKYLYFFGIYIFFISIKNLIPLSFDSFYFYSEKTIENIWSFDELIFLELTLIILLLVFSQIPVLSFSIFTTEKFLHFLPKIFKLVIFTIFVLSGLLTPTVDGYTQLGFAIYTIILYFFILHFFGKRIYLKNVGFTFLN